MTLRNYNTSSTAVSTKPDPSAPAASEYCVTSGTTQYPSAQAASDQCDSNERAAEICEPSVDPDVHVGRGICLEDGVHRVDVDSSSESGDGSVDYTDGVYTDSQIH